MMAARVAPLLVRLGDGDGDGFGRWFGGLDCDDSEESVNPLAADLPGDGVDQDCFEGDLAPAAIAADRAERQRGRRPPARRAENLLLVTVDALRADAVGFGGAKKPSSPNLDRLARRSAVFTAAWSPAPMTRKAFPALLSGRYPSNVHWVDLETNYPYPVSHEDNLYLAEVLRDAGLATGMTCDAKPSTSPGPPSDGGHSRRTARRRARLDVAQAAVPVLRIRKGIAG